jgi:hypothetical protein
MASGPAVALRPAACRSSWYSQLESGREAVVGIMVEYAAAGGASQHEGAECSWTGARLQAHSQRPSLALARHRCRGSISQFTQCFGHPDEALTLPMQMTDDILSGFRHLAITSLCQEVCVCRLVTFMAQFLVTRLVMGCQSFGTLAC